MLFCQPVDVNEMWEIVAKATANNELGIAAKVAPRPQSDDSGRTDRLICVYTSDFRDQKDVLRVLRKMKELRLFDATGRGIYYKAGTLTPYRHHCCSLLTITRCVYLPRNLQREPLGYQGVNV